MRITTEQYNVIADLTDEQLGQLTRALIESEIVGNAIITDKSVLIAYNFIKNA